MQLGICQNKNNHIGLLMIKIEIRQRFIKLLHLIYLVRYSINQHLHFCQLVSKGEILISLRHFWMELVVHILLQPFQLLLWRQCKCSLRVCPQLVKHYIKRICTSKYVSSYAHAHTHSYTMTYFISTTCNTVNQNFKTTKSHYYINMQLLH